MRAARECIGRARGSRCPGGRASVATPHRDARGTSVVAGGGLRHGYKGSRGIAWRAIRRTRTLRTRPTVTFVAVSGGSGALPVDTRLPLGGSNVCTEVARTGRPARSDGYGDASGPIAVAARGRGVRRSIGAPIVVEGRLWGRDGYRFRRRAASTVSTSRRTSATSPTCWRPRSRRLRFAPSWPSWWRNKAALRRIATSVAHGSTPGRGIHCGHP